MTSAKDTVTVVSMEEVICVAAENKWYKYNVDYTHLHTPTPHTHTHTYTHTHTRIT